jgi:hypothetical protein
MLFTSAIIGCCKGTSHNTVSIIPDTIVYKRTLSTCTEVRGLTCYAYDHFRGYLRAECISTRLSTFTRS